MIHTPSLFYPYPPILPGIDLAVALVMQAHFRRVAAYHYAVCQATPGSREQHTLHNLRFHVAQDACLYVRRELLETALLRMN